MATQRAATVASALEAKGMKRDESHHHMFRKQIAGVTTLAERCEDGLNPFLVRR